MTDQDELRAEFEASFEARFGKEPRATEGFEAESLNWLLKRYEHAVTFKAAAEPRDKRIAELEQQLTAAREEIAAMERTATEHMETADHFKDECRRLEDRIAELDPPPPHPDWKWFRVAIPVSVEMGEEYIDGKGLAIIETVKGMAYRKEAEQLKDELAQVTQERDACQETARLQAKGDGELIAALTAQLEQAERARGQARQDWSEVYTALTAQIEWLTGEINATEGNLERVRGIVQNALEYCENGPNAELGREHLEHALKRIHDETVSDAPARNVKLQDLQENARSEWGERGKEIAALTAQLERVRGALRAVQGQFDNEDTGDPDRQPTDRGYKRVREMVKAALSETDPAPDAPAEQGVCVCDAPKYDVQMSGTSPCWKCGKPIKEGK